jgi:hypothetical protein
MPVDIPLLLKIAENIKNFLGDLDKNKLAKNDRLKTVLLAVLTAANETRSYLADMKEKKRHDRETETRLAALWTKASVELLEFDKDLAGICKLSGEYWSDPKAWSYREINAVKRVLHVISDRAQRLMTI